MTGEGALMDAEVKDEQAAEIFELIVQSKMLPETVEELVPVSFIGAAAVKFYKAKIKLMNQLKMTDAQRKATLRDGQDAGDMLLDIEARIGELLPSAEEAERGTSTNGERYRRPEGMTNKRARAARTIKDNPEVVARIKAQARENEDIPTKTAVLNEVRYRKDRARQAAAEAAREGVTGIPYNKEHEYFRKMRTNASVELLKLLVAWDNAKKPDKIRFVKWQRYAFPELFKRKERKR